MQTRLQSMDKAHAEAFDAGSKVGRNDAYSTIATNLLAHAERLESTGGVVESACARVLRRAAGNIRHHITPSITPEAPDGAT